ncbi:hypothetical protein EES45_23005 [Streptomyces sp. ADI97-07]|uniref:DUF6221 family protein n=1 Tax=Streptomyces sp. ADI97-07 TaxID=1522762 RepID=UPI000F551EFE|nr:DUF6221 family protein [Streptomyces sp. ADI97-07]RPK76550.1 hypothetical protein EES45_23005 [Streptomyces sp. ADI97-07]
MDDDLVQFLRDRLDEDAAAAQSAASQEGGGTWEVLRLPPMDTPSVCGRPQPGEYALPVIVDLDDHERAAHIARHDPARVLAEVDTKRLLMYQFENRGNSVRGSGQSSTGGVWDSLLRMLALPYSGHPDYRDEWRP